MKKLVIGILALGLNGYAAIASAQQAPLGATSCTPSATHACVQLTYSNAQGAGGVFVMKNSSIDGLYTASSSPFS